jgi:hypothetical protein
LVMGGVADDPFGLERWLLPDVVSEGEAYEAMLEAVEGRLAALHASWKELHSQPEWPQDAADALTDEGASAEAIRVDIAEIALTAIFHWVERRCALLLARKAAAKGDDAKTMAELASAGLREESGRAEGAGRRCGEPASLRTHRRRAAGVR